MILDKNGKAFGSEKNKNESFPIPKNPHGIIDTLVEIIVTAVSVPFTFISTVLEHFLTPGSNGTKMLGGIGFIFGTLMSADSIWQALFQGPAMFPWYEESWIGWIGWVKLPFNLFFWLATSMSALVQIMEARTLRGKTPNQARVEFEESQQYSLPARPSGKIDLSQALWRDYKRAGMRERSTGASVALFFWIFDITTTFIGRNPWRYTDPGEIFRCFMYNILTMMAGETGFAIWKLTKR